VKDYSYSKELNAYIKQNEKDEKRIHAATGKDALDENLRMLQNGALDVIAEDDNVINYYIMNKSAEYRIKSVGTPVKRDNISDNYLYIAFSPKNPKAAKYAKLLDQGMAELRRTGELGRILELYHVVDWYGISKK
jgi:polar amino acid transport system substrate-binding protein